MFRPDIPEDDVDNVIAEHSHDLRKIKQTMQLALPDNRSVASDTIDYIVRLFFNAHLDTGFRTTLTNTEEGLAGLHIHENILPFISSCGPHCEDHVHGSCCPEHDAQRIKLYADILDKVGRADTVDFFTFFYQQWALFPVSMQLKLHYPNAMLRPYITNIYTHVDDPDFVEYVPLRKTPIISKQSILYNQFTSLALLKKKMNCSQHDVLYWVATLRRCETATQWAQIRTIGPTIPLGRLAALAPTEMKKMVNCYWLDGKGREWKVPTVGGRRAAKKPGVASRREETGTTVTQTALPDLFNEAYNEMMGIKPEAEDDYSDDGGYEDMDAIDPVDTSDSIGDDDEEESD